MPSRRLSEHLKRLSLSRQAVAGLVHRVVGHGEAVLRPRTTTKCTKCTALQSRLLILAAALLAFLPGVLSYRDLPKSHLRRIDLGAVQELVLRRALHGAAELATQRGRARPRPSLALHPEPGGGRLKLPASQGKGYSDVSFMSMSVLLVMLLSTATLGL